MDLLVSCWRPFVPAATTLGPEHGRVVRNRRAASSFDFGPRPLRRSKLSKTGPGFGRQNMPSWIPLLERTLLCHLVRARGPLPALGQTSRADKESNRHRRLCLSLI